ncbi:MAG TPA: hypothetical protein VE075_07320 [Thermoanaerobaculia bacterium]|nr:hypothetical protein [Thermoanaerobaculia bacterium]
MARARRGDPRAAATRRRRLVSILGGLIALAALAAAASRFGRWWRVPEVAVAGAPAGVVAALRRGLVPAAGVDVPWGLDMGPQLTIAGDLIAAHARPDANLRYFEEAGLPWVPGLRPCPMWGDDFASGTSVFSCRFASADSAAALIAYYRHRLGEKGMTWNGGDTAAWVLPRATGNPGVGSRRGLTIRPYDYARERASSSCLAAPPIAARAVVTIDMISWVRNWRRH